MDIQIDRLEAIIAEKNEEIAKLNGQLSMVRAPLLTIFSNLSHEVRTPLNGIIGFSELLAISDEIPEEFKLYTGVIAESSNILMALLNDVFDMIKIESGKFHVYPTPFDLSDMLFRLYQEYSHIAENKKIHLYLENFISEEKIIYSDQSVLIRIIKKLLDNALKFTKEGWVSLMYEEADDQIIFSVEDTGIGISHELRNNLFARFISEDVSKSRHIGGTGLDLSLCNGLVKLLGGEMWLKDKEENGTIFQFSIRNEVKQ